MRIAIAQISTAAGDFEATAQRMVEFSRRAKDQKADLVVFPKAVLAGVAAVPSQDREGFLLDLADCLTGLVEELACPAIVPVLTDLGGTPMSEAMLLSSDGIVPLRMTAAFESLKAHENQEDALPLPEFEFGGAKFGLAFTYEDLDDYDEYDYDVDVILYLPGYGFAVDDASSALGTAVSESRFLADAETTGAWIVAAGSLGCYDSQVFVGSSFVLAPWGELAAQAPTFEEALIVCDVDPNAEGPLAHALTQEVYDPQLTLWGALTLGLQRVCEQRGRTDVCLLIDKTMESMLAATLAVDALGPLRVHVLLAARDCGGTTDPEQLVKNLRLPKANVVRQKDLKSEDEAGLADLAQVRLARIAHKRNALVLNHRNKTQLALEGTRDVCAADLYPFGDLYLSDVCSLAHLRNAISPVFVTGPAYLDAPEVALDLEQFASVDARIKFVDQMLLGYIEGEGSVSDLVQSMGHAEAIEAIVRLVGRSAQDRTRLGDGSVLVMSCRTLLEAAGPLGVAWQDHARPKDERITPEALAKMVKEHLIAPEDAESLAEGSEEDAPARPHADGSDMRDMLGYLRDFSQGGAFDQDEGQDGKDGGTRPLWGGPFSDN